MKRVLITGGSGFIGRNLCEQLSEEYELFAPSHSELDILNFRALAAYAEKNRIETVIHAAVHVPSVNGTEHEFFNDMKMFANIEKLSHLTEKVIYFGSGAEYDKQRSIRMITEDRIGECIPNTEYGLAKYTMNTIARESDNIYNLRLFGVFGKYELWQIKFLSNLCCKAVYNLPLSIRSNCYFDFLYIDELIQLTKWFVNGKPKYHDYNAVSGKEYLLSELAEKVKMVSKKELPIMLLSKERNLDYSADNSRLRREIGEAWKPEVIDRSLEKLYEYYLREKDLIDFDILSKSR